MLWSNLLITVLHTVCFSIQCTAVTMSMQENTRYYYYYYYYYFVVLLLFIHLLLEQ